MLMVVMMLSAVHSAGKPLSFGHHAMVCSLLNHTMHAIITLYSLGQNEVTPLIIFAIFLYSRIVLLSISADANKFCFYANKL